MEANELRIGNYAMGNKPFAVDANHIAMAYNHEIAQNGHERFKSIPLTEGWLIRAGFENDEITWSIKILLTTDEMAVLMLSKTKVGYAVSLNFITNQIANVEYVHTLQNLIFALTGTELTLKK